MAEEERVLLREFAIDIGVLDAGILHNMGRRRGPAGGNV